MIDNRRRKIGDRYVLTNGIEKRLFPKKNDFIRRETLKKDDEGRDLIAKHN